VFQNNTALGPGGAIRTDGGGNGLRAHNNTFRNNTSNNSGGAIYISNMDVYDIGPNFIPPFTDPGDVPPHIDNNTFERNTAGDVGGAIYVDSGNTWLSIFRNTFRQNTATNEGGALNIGSSSSGASNDGVFVYKNGVWSNSARNGGGLNVRGDVLNLAVYNNVVARNNAQVQGGNVRFDSSVTITNMDFYNNTVASGSAGTTGGGVYVNQTSGTPVAWWNNISYLNMGGDLESTTALDAWNSIVGVVRNLATCQAANACYSTNPLFVNAPADDYHLQNSSPAIDLGATSDPTPGGGGAPSSPVDDFDNVLRDKLPDAGAFTLPGGQPGLPTATPTVTSTATETLTPGGPATETPTVTQTPTVTNTSTPTMTPCIPTKITPQVPCHTPTPGNTATPTATLDGGLTATTTATPTATVTATGTIETASTATSSPSPSATNSPTVTLTATATQTPTQTPTRTITLTPPPFPTKLTPTLIP
jgi:predicted outer membrane repeat protein